MPVAVSITPLQTDAQNSLRAFLLDLFPGATVVAANPNRVAEPRVGSFIVMSPISFQRQATNSDSVDDVRIVGSIAQTTLTVTAVVGPIVPGLVIQGPAVAANTSIVRQLSGPSGGTGTYQVSVSQTLPSTILSAGAIQITATYFFSCQLDFHSADYTASAWAQTFATAFRDQYAVAFFAALPTGGTISPLYADDAAMRPFYNDQQQFEWRWVVDAKLQIDQTVTVPQTYADSAAVTLYEVP